MIFRFAHYELDEGTRELRYRGREVFLQPRVFDLLVYLARHRGRVVGKDELLEALWPGVLVTDGSLQRAVSLIRTALRQGGLEEAIRTYSRQGYRFCAELAVEEAAAAPAAPAAALQRAREAYGKGAWEDAIAAFREADRSEGGLAAVDLERWAYAVQCTGRLAEATAPLERAVASHGAAGDRRGAARAALQLTHVHLEEGRLIVAKGWHRRAASFLEGEPECQESGLHVALAGRLAFFEGDMERAVQHAEAARAAGRRLSSPDVEAIGLLYGGHGRLALGEVQRALGLFDEAAAAVLAGQVSPWIGGLVYCGVIWACRNLGDWQRAAQWHADFARWCERSGVLTYSGSCHLHRAEVLAVCGELVEAEREIREACRLVPMSAAGTEGEAQRILGELCLAQGDLAGAEAAFKRAHRLGYDPQPGYALLQEALGRPEAAIRSLERSLEERSWMNRQRRGTLLCHLAAIAAAAGRPETANGALEQLEAEPGIWATPALAAVRARAWAELAFAEGHVSEAIDSLRRAVELWREAGSPLNAAWARLRLAQLLVAEGDSPGAELELSAAEGVAATLEAKLLSTRIAAAREALGLAA